MPLKNHKADIVRSNDDKKYLVEGYVDFSRVKALLRKDDDYEVSILAKGPGRPGAKPTTDGS